MAETSYPFLQIAKRSGVSYGAVLAYRDAIVKVLGGPGGYLDFDVWETEAQKTIGPAHLGIGADIFAAVQKEDARRRAAIDGAL
jgi:hypothetical protein